MRVAWSEALSSVIGSLYGAIDFAVCWVCNIMSIFAIDYEGRLHPQRNIQDLP